MKSKELAFIQAVDRYADAIKDLPWNWLAVEAVSKMLDNIAAGKPEEEITVEFISMFPKDCVSQHLAAMRKYLSELLTAYIADHVTPAC